MKKTVTLIILGAAFCGCLAWIAVAPRMQAMIPSILAILIAEAIAWAYNTPKSAWSKKSSKTTR